MSRRPPRSKPRLLGMTSVAPRYPARSGSGPDRSDSPTACGFGCTPIGPSESWCGAPSSRPCRGLPAEHHERLDASGYHRNASAPELGLAARVLAAVIEAADLSRPRAAWPSGLTDREVDVLRLCARGISNREIADSLVVSARTVQHHLASVYDKTRRRTRAGAAVFAIGPGIARLRAGAR